MRDFEGDGFEKAIMSTYILCKILSCQVRIAQKVLKTKIEQSLAQIPLPVNCVLHALSAFRANRLIARSGTQIAYPNEANIEIQDSLIRSLCSY